jgi:hypothetical protein
VQRQDAPFCSRSRWLNITSRFHTCALIGLRSEILFDEVKLLCHHSELGHIQKAPDRRFRFGCMHSYCRVYAGPQVALRARSTKVSIVLVRFRLVSRG